MRLPCLEVLTVLAGCFFGVAVTMHDPLKIEDREDAKWQAAQQQDSITYLQRKNAKRP